MKTRLKLAFQLCLMFASGIAWGQDPVTFDYTGAVQLYVVPPGVTAIEIQASGASGMDHGSSSGGLGGYISGEIDVTPGETLEIYVGGTTGFNGGGAADNGGGDFAGVVGGGASDVRQGGSTFSDRVVVAGGGGGAGRGTCDNNGGGGGGYPGGFGGLSSDILENTGGTGTATAGGDSGIGSCTGDCSCSPGGGGGGGGNGGGAGGNYGIFGGTNAIGGTGGACGEGGVDFDGPGGTNSAGLGGCFGLGGDGGINTRGGGGGGGGWYGGGGGGGNWGTGGGGGSSYVIPAASALAFTNATHSGDGQVIITPLCIALTTTVSGTTFCDDGEELTLEAASTTGGTVTWDMGVVDGEAFVPPVGVTTYTATSDSDEDCEFSVEITVHALPTVTASVDDDEICLGDEFVFTGGGATTYAWDMSVTDGVAIEPLVASTETYTVTGTDDNGCENTASVDATVHALPTVTASVDDEEICLGDEFTFTGGGATTYTWDMGVTDDVAFEPLVASTETYTVTGTDDNGCVNTATIDGTVHALPTVTASVDDDDICFGESVTFNGGGATTYTWDMGVIDDTEFTPDTEGTTTYTVTGTDDNGCENTASVDVSVSPEIFIAAVVVDETMGDGSIDLTITGGVPTYSYDWDTDEADDFDDPEDLTDLSAGFYTVVVRDANGCEKDTTIEIILLCTPMTVVVSHTVICENELLTLDATSASGADITWDGGATDGVGFLPEMTGLITYTATSDDPLDCILTVDVEVLPVPVVNPTIGGETYCDGDVITLGAGGDADEYTWDPEDFTPPIGVTTYTLTGVYDATGCSNSATIDVTMNALPTVTATTDHEDVCIGNPIVLAGTGALTYAWDPAEIEDGMEYEPADIGTYTYTVVGTDVNGCTDSDEISITVVEEIEITYTVIDEMIFEDGEIDITVTGGVEPYTFDWDNDGTGDFDDDEDLTGLADGSYTVVVNGASGCSATEAYIYLGSQASISENTASQINVYPNPTVDRVNIEKAGQFEYKIMDVAGKLILSGVGVDLIEISMKDVTAGTYLIQIQSEGLTQTTKFVKN